MTNESIAGKRSLRAILSTVLALVLIVATFASTALADTLDQYDVTIIDNTETYAITTNETEPIVILEKAGITLNANDNLDISGYEEGKGGAIIVNRLNDVNIEFAGNIKKYSVYANTVGDALAEIGITAHKGDKFNYDLTDEVKAGMVIKMDTPYYTTLKCDGATVKYPIASGNVDDLLRLAGVKLGKNDYTIPSSNIKLKKGMSVSVFRVSYKTVIKDEVVKYKTKTQKDKKMPVGKTKVITKGVNGSDKVTYKFVYVNGKVNKKTELSRVQTKKAVTKVVKVGTMYPNGVKPNGVKSKRGIKLGETITGKYTHYCACAICNGNSRGITSSGKKIKNGMANPYYIACNWLPLGSVLDVDGKIYTVVDRGGSGLSPKGRIDIFTPEGHSACYRYGTGKCTIKVLRLGW